MAIRSWADSFLLDGIHGIDAIEWDDTTLGNSLELFKGSDEWHAARGVNIELHERLDASRLLDPPDARIG